MGKITWEMSAEEAVGSSRAAFIKKIYELAQTNDKICLVNCDCSPKEVYSINLDSNLEIALLIRELWSKMPAVWQQDLHFPERPYFARHSDLL